MRRLPVVSVAALLCFMAMSTSSQAEQKELSGDRIATDNGDLVIHPVSHATFLMQWNGKTVYVDPVGGIKPFGDLPKPDLVLVTHHHFDHFDPKTLEALVPAGGKMTLFAPPTAAEKIPETLRGKAATRPIGTGEPVPTFEARFPPDVN